MDFLLFFHVFLVNPRLAAAFHASRIARFVPLPLQVGLDVVVVEELRDDHGTAGIAIEVCTQ